MNVTRIASGLNRKPVMDVYPFDEIHAINLINCYSLKCSNAIARTSWQSFYGRFHIFYAGCIKDSLCGGSIYLPTQTKQLPRRHGDSTCTSCVSAGKFPASPSAYKAYKQAYKYYIQAVISV